MKVNTPIGKIFAATMAAGAVTLGAVGFGGTAYADSPPQAPAATPGIIAPPFNQPMAQPQAPVVNPVAWNTQYVAPYLYNGRYVYPYVNRQYLNQVAYANQFRVQYPLVYSNQVVTASQFSFITATANVLGMNRADVLVLLQQGRSLTQIAAERGVQRAFLFNAVIGNLQASINTAVATGAINPVTGQALLAGVNNRVGITIDQPGTTSGTNLGAIEAAYQLFS